MAITNLEFPKRWGGLTSIELLGSITDPDEQELLMYYLMGKYMWKKVLFTTVEQESRTEELKQLRLSILAIICDEDEMIDMRKYRPQGKPIKKTHPRPTGLIRK